MNILRYKIIYVLFLLILTACRAEEIRAQSNADTAAVQSQQDVLNQEQSRQQAADLHSIQMRDMQFEQARREAVEADVRDGWSVFIRWFFLFGTAAMVYAMFQGTKVTVAAYRVATAGIANAIVQMANIRVQAAEIRSRLIYLDDGRQFPAMVDKNMITDITTGATISTDEQHPGSPQSIAGATANRHVGIVAKETRRSGPDTAPSTALAQNPPIIEAKFSDVKEYFEMVAGQRKEKNHE